MKVKDKGKLNSLMKGLQIINAIFFNGFWHSAVPAIKILSIEVSPVYTKSGEGNNKKLVKACKQFFLFMGEGFSPNLGFRKFLCSQEVDSVLFQVSWKFCVH